MTTTCSKCGKTFEHPTRMKAEFALAMHTSRMHRGEKTGDETADKIEARREYLRQWRLRQKRTRSNGQETVLAFCPRCGMNLQVLATALAVVNKV